MKQKPTYIVATIKPWNIKLFHGLISKYPGRWILVTDPKKLTPEFVLKLKPRYIFFPHWSWIVPKEILDAAECVCFHEAAVPYGRGGSPIQNLIVRGHKHTKISALRMEEGLDTGPVYMQRPLSLQGSAQEIFERAAPIVAGMIKTIAERNPKPKKQTGKVTVFKRRTPNMSDITQLAEPTIENIYDHIRMLDADTYPHAFIDLPKYRIEFTNARKKNGTIQTDSVIIKKSP